MTTLSEVLADFICQEKKLNEEVIQLSKQSILDCFGAMIMGSGTPVCRMAEGLKHSAGNSTVVGFSGGYSAEDAAFINGISGHELELDDTSSSNLGHPTVAVLPALLAIGEQLNISGQQLLESFAVATEVECKIGRLCARDLHKRGWHASSITGVLGAAAGVSYLLGHDRQKTMHSLGLAASMASGIRENFGTPTKSVHIGKCAQDGLKAALLAETGFTASPAALDGQEGYLFEYTNRRYDTDWNEFAKTLGNDYDIVSPGFSIKQYPSCSSTHRPVDAFIDLVEGRAASSVDGGSSARAEEPTAAGRLAITPDNIARITIGLSSAALRELVSPDPKTGDEAKFSVGFQIALYLLGIPNMPEFYSEEIIERPDVQQIIKRTEMYLVEEYDQLPADMGVGPALVRVSLVDGVTLEQKRNFPVGHRTDPMPAATLREKFLNCSVPFLGEEKAAELYRQLMALEQVEQVWELMKLCC